MPKTPKAKYVDGYVLIVPKDQVAAYKKMAKDANKMWLDAGALEYYECIGDDLSPDMGKHKVLTFTNLAKAKKDETVWFSFITYKSRTHRDQVNAKVHAEMKKYAEEYKDVPMPFDLKRMAYGGFKVAVNG